MKNLTIKMKLIVAFTIVAILVTILATYSILSISKASDGFTSYREMAKDSVLAGRVQANMLMVRLNVKDYIKTSSQKDIDEFNYYFQRADGFMQEAKKEIQKPSRAPLVDKVSKDLVVYKDLFTKLIELKKKQNDIVINNFKINGIKIEKTLNSVMKNMEKSKNIKIPFEASKAINTMLLARLYTARFIIFNTKVEHDRVLSEFQILKIKLKDIKNLISDEQINQKLEKTLELLNIYEKGIIQIREISLQRDDIVHNGLNKIGPEIAKLSEDVKLSIKKDQDEIGPEVKRLNENINKVVVIISIIILLLVVSLAFIIPRNISNLISTFQTGLLDFFKYLNKETNKAALIEITSKDEIGQMSKSVNKGILKVQELIQENDKQQWIQNGITKLNEKLIGDSKMEVVAKKSIDFICNYANAGVGVLYILNHKNKTLNEFASFAHIKRDELSNKFNLGEGVVGQVALQKTSIQLHNIKREQMTIDSGIISQAPFNTYTFALIYQNVVFGVIEIGSFEKFESKTLEFLEQINEIVATSISTSIQNKKVEELLKETEIANNELQIKQDQLKESNISMQEQQQQLEEANSNMEEQQQQLEEANANMEEQQQQLKISEQNLKLQNQQLEDTKKDIQKKADELKQSSAYKSEFLANMSHELRTPLNSIILLSSLLQRNSKETLNIDDIKKAKTIFESGNELLRLINDILDLSKVESGKMHVIIDKFKSSSLLQQMKDSFEYTAIDKGLTFEIIDEYNNFIFSDKDRISQIIRNLVSNAFKFTKEGTVTLKVSASKQEDKDVQISVIDTGIGIAQDKQDLIFKAFTQASGGTSREFGGTGLGLSISRELTKLLHGNISLSSQENKGSTFNIDLENLSNEDIKLEEDNDRLEKPLQQTTLEKKSISKVQSSTIEDDRNNISSIDETYLIIDDDKTFAQVVYEEIKRNKQYALVALDGHSGLDLVKKYNIKGILLDLTLPDISGIDVLKELKSNSTTRHIPVHVISAKDKDSQTLELGAIGYLQKPALEDDISNVLTSLDSFKNKKIKDLLIVEDNKVHREALIELIGEGVNIKGVKTASQAISEVKKKKYDTVVVDLGLEDGSGYEVCEYIKNSHANIPIIIYTGKELSDQEKIKLQEYSNSIIIKTVNSNERILNEINLFLHRDSIEEEKKSNEIFETIDLEDLNILIVDDDIKNIFVLDAALKEFNATTYTAFNGQEAFDFLETHNNIDLVLMDIMMPVMNGYEAIEKIRNDERLKELPIIAVTAKAMKEDREKCISLGANDYLSKPINLNVLGKMIKAWSNKK